MDDEYYNSDEVQDWMNAPMGKPKYGKMNIDELWKKYATWTEGIGEWIHKDNFTQAIAEITSSPVEPGVSQENGGRECPVCGGGNSKADGGNDRCFHCATCGFVQCATTPKDLIYMLKKRINKFYKDNRFSG